MSRSHATLWPRDHPHFAVAFVAFLVALALYLETMAPGLTWAHYGADGGDLAIAVALGSVPHPTGYPTYLLLASLFARLPWGDLHARLNAMSALFAAATVGLTTWTTAHMTSPWEGGLAGAALATSTLFWSQALITEVYALHAFWLAALIAWAMWGRWSTRTWRWALGGGIVTGLALGNHLSTLLLLPGLVWIAGILPARRRVALWMGGVAIGLLPYGWLPLRARAHMPLNWGGADTWAGFWWLVTGRLYQHYLTVPTPASLLRKVQQLAALTLDQFGWWGFLLAALALFAAHQGAMAAYRRLTLWVASVSLGWALLYTVTDWPVYTLPAWVVLAVWVADGAVLSLEEIGARGVTRFLGSRGKFLPFIALALFLITGLVHGPRVSLRYDQEALITAQRVWEALPRNALVLVDGDRATFALGYTHFVQKQRPDVRLINRALWGFEWYRESLQAYYGDLLPPSGPVHLQALIDAHPARPVYLVGEHVPSAVRFAPNGPLYTLRPVGKSTGGPLRVGRIR